MTARREDNKAGSAVDLGTLIKILIRRWYVVIPIVAIALASAFGIGLSMEPVYQSRGSVLLVGPNTQGGDEVNPLAELRSPLNTTALAISIIAADEQTRTEIRALGFTGAYTVDVTPSTPIINVRVRARTPEQALLTLEAVIEAVQLKLDERQRGVEAPENALIQTEVLTRTTTARAVFGSRDRAVTVVAGLGLVAAASAAILVNSWATRRERDGVDVDQRVTGPVGRTDISADSGDSADIGVLSETDESVSLEVPTDEQDHSRHSWWQRLRHQARTTNGTSVKTSDNIGTVSSRDESAGAVAEIESTDQSAAEIGGEQPFGPPTSNGESAIGFHEDSTLMDEETDAALRDDGRSEGRNSSAQSPHEF